MNKDSRKKDNFEEAIRSVLAEKAEIPADLFPRIMSAIFRRQRLYAGLKTGGFLISSLGSLVVIFFAAQEVIWQFGQNGILNILSLLFSDLAVVLVNWQAFVLSCLESLPVFPIVLISGAALLLLVSLKFVVENTVKLKTNFYPKLIIN